MVTVLSPILWLCGPTGVGKSAVGWEIFSQVLREGARAAYLDLAQVGFCLPAPADDPQNHRVRAANLGAMWSVFRAAGVRCLVVSGGVEHPDAVGLYSAAVPGAVLTLCRLRAGRDRMTDRILARGRGEGTTLPGDELLGAPATTLRRLAEQAIRDSEELDRAGFGDVCVDIDDATVEEAARRVRAETGDWPTVASGA